ncbi:putative membrane protein [Weissella uvarum]|uniref:DUF1361 domain-containing protein n=1 Tax=Weissella uvarum TaxID=1479233 RepID=UPI00195F97CD|nr:DUF1361 domain-containing protein [Weissella uvarum]MBM7618078.1 putative membrane protein [Weissella uvarum]MCM0595934.1 DUF1361 domain-containing protein [Weissella uvarum]
MEQEFTSARWVKLGILNGMVVLVMLAVAVLPTPNKFLIWNLFLATLPLDLGYVVAYLKAQHMHHGWVMGLALLWLLFYPNALYMITDYIHLPESGLSIINPYTVWNFGLLSVAILLGVLFAIESGYQMRFTLVKQRSWWSSAIFYTGLSILTALGVYLGRYLRLNSWEVFTSPGIVLRAIAQVIFRDLSFTCLFVGVFVLLQLILFATYHALKRP